MNNSASRFDSKHPAGLADSRFSCAASSRQFHPAVITSVMKFPVQAQPLLTLQRMALQEVPAICICNDFRAAQRYFCEAAGSEGFGLMQPHIVHEMMPAHQQDFIIDNINAARDMTLSCNVVIVTTKEFFPEIAKRLDWFVESAQTIGQLPDPLPHRWSLLSPAAEPTVSCICLRATCTGKWVLMDHDEATTVNPGVCPPQEIAARLLRHTVNVSGHRLAPYLATMFDVPHFWKADARLATRSLLVFQNNVCNLGCYHAGIPSKIIWDDQLGIVFGA